MSTMRIRAQAIKELEDKLGRVTAEQLVRCSPPQDTSTA